MTKRHEDICDNCSKRIAEKKCILCQNDLCTSCIRSSFEMTMRSSNYAYSMGKVVFCKECRKKMIDKLGSDALFDEDFNKETCDRIGGYLIKKMMLENLK